MRYCFRQTLENCRRLFPLTFPQSRLRATIFLWFWDTHESRLVTLFSGLSYPASSSLWSSHICTFRFHFTFSILFYLCVAAGSRNPARVLWITCFPTEGIMGSRDGETSQCSVADSGVSQHIKPPSHFPWAGRTLRHFEGLLKAAGCTKQYQKASCWLHRQSTVLEAIWMMYFKGEKAHSLFCPCKADPSGPI